MGTRKIVERRTGVTEQLSFLHPVDLKAVRKIVIKELKDYRALKVQLENKKESVDAGISPFPSIRDSFILNELKVKQMERALENSLDDEERMIIEKKYLTASQTKDIHIYMELGMKKDTYYEIKHRAILRIATALGII
ncbi:ArpU family phage packaging/lysis transcriptional regulator [Bacillus subtilis]|uniref:ArpU family phage packaging/lysis transcriptional regulator n=1 Tax=Bacillus subtilis TaxID=1423 RepID=UPI00100A06CA|nr:ArpU family phage packaging/lysis transcriptional regulator [Bacillus subtilis]MEC0286014.1 ArpU family phage packaging/lysis transcriptional regulator [Bacillus subtilis]MEC0479779.1 ArpU family phage packaging/lysis transcriptional regulator [Bacillus subtilis]MEC0524826.1 ArpU family phage packaging/lysis transcriptional regulator [Bacillus subtilis]QAW00299.1 ArpU family transcriptional regulator [Bacillus subtilis]QWV85461.1 ArpU family transcriptional regulator [Bacillus subtilis subs